MNLRRWRLGGVLMWLFGWALVAQAGVDVDDLLKRCAPNIHPETMRAVLSAESKGNALAVADAGPVALPWSERKHLVRSHYPGSLPEAVTLVKGLLANGHTVSLGLSQINDRNLSALGVSIEEVFEPCANVAAGARVLSECYGRASKEFGPGARALRAALSCYNSGSFVRGERDGYVDLVYQNKDKPLLIRESGVQVANKGIRVPAITGMVNGSNTAWQKRVARAGKDERRGAKDFTLLVSSFGEN